MSINTSPENLKVEGTDVSASNPVPVSGTVTATPTGTQNVDVTANTVGLATSAKQDTLLTELQLKADLTETQPVSLASVPTHAVTATDLDIRNLSQTQDAVLAYGSDDGGTTKRVIKTDSGGAIQVDLEVANVTVSNSFLTESDFDTKTGSLTETAPATDTASSGLNGRLQRIAQRLTSFIALFPTSLGQKARTASLATTLSTEDITALTPPAAISGFATETTLASIKDTAGIKKITDALPAGTNAIGKLAANSGVDIGDVDVLTLPAITGTVTANDSATTSLDGKTPDLSGIWGYHAGTSGTLTMTGSKRVLQITAVSLEGAGSFTINAGDTITLPYGSTDKASTSISVEPKSNLVSPEIIFTGTDSFFVEYIS